MILKVKRKHLKLEKYHWNLNLIFSLHIFTFKYFFKINQHYGPDLAPYASIFVFFFSFLQGICSGWDFLQMKLNASAFINHLLGSFMSWFQEPFCVFSVLCDLLLICPDRLFSPYVPPVSSLQTLCRKAIQKHIVHRMAIDWLQLPEALKHFCKYEWGV